MHVILMDNISTYNMYIMTPSDHISHDLSYFSGPKTSGANKKMKVITKCEMFKFNNNKM